ncbi:mitochondrial 37S ribosomal protein uS15m [Limtongia smithiae]|uniref:mitochondrial 37S ribosomal protein uS15m n=1 Tax=Limtongia smithiae TaxID=1125753 RepID=UPI0034CEE547
MVQLKRAPLRALWNVHTRDVSALPPLSNVRPSPSSSTRTTNIASTMTTTTARGYTSRRKGALTNKQIAEIRAQRPPYIETKKFLKTAKLGTNAIYGTYTPFIRQILRGIGAVGASTKASTARDADAAAKEIEARSTLAHGYTEAEVKIAMYNMPVGVSGEKLKEEQDSVMKTLSLRAANLAQWRQLEVSRVITDMGTHSLDTGSPEAQAGVMTVRILGLAEHIKENFHDYTAIRQLTILVQQRNSMLKYLRKRHVARYTLLLQRLGLDDGVVTKEFRFSKRLLE